MGKPGAFLEVGRKEHGVRPPEQSLRDFDDLTLPLTLDEQRQQASRCMMCGVAFCQTGISFGRARVSGCPLHNLIPEFNDLVYRGLWQDAYERLTLTNPFPEFTGRVCPALCEAACNLGLHDEPTSIRDDERAISDVAWDASEMAPLAPAAAGAPSVSVVGSGPSGLACAWELARRGFKVRVFERSDAPGGLMMYGIPNMKLPKEVVARRADLMRESGIVFECGVDASDPLVAERIVSGSDAIVVAVGAGAARRLSVPGSDAKGIHLAVDYLTSSTKSVLSGTAPAIDARGLDVVVIGGGDTGTDCVATALRQGARSVRQLEFMPAAPETRAPSNLWPEWPNVKKTDYGQLEAIDRQGADPRTFAADTREVLVDEGHVTGLSFVSLDWSSGKPERIEGSEQVVPAQLVLIAMGFSGPAADVYEALGCETVEFRGGVRPKLADPSSHRVAAQDARVFAAGDTRSGSSLVVSAISDGLACAAEVARELGR